jgi:hypothetical protein
MTATGLRKHMKSASGLPSRITRSARLQAAIVPIMSDFPRNSAGLLVAAIIASIGSRPRIDQEGQFVMQAGAMERVGCSLRIRPRQEPNLGLMHHFDEIMKASKPIPVELVILGRWEIGMVSPEPLSPEPAKPQIGMVSPEPPDPTVSPEPGSLPVLRPRASPALPG